MLDMLFRKRYTRLYDRLAIQPHLMYVLTGDTDDQALEEEFVADVQKLRRILSDVHLQDIDEIPKYIYLTRLAYIFDDDKYFRYDSGDFYTEKGLEKYLIDEKVIGDEERIIQSLLLYETPQQHTWLVTTEKYLICLLDEEWTQKYRTVIQWKMDIHSFPLEKIKAYQIKNGTNVVELGRQAPYLYSEKLYSKPKELEEAIRRLIINK